MLVKNDTLEEIANRLATTKPDFKSAVEEFKKTRDNNSNGHLFGDTTLRKFLSEVGLNLSLREISSDYNEDVNFDPMEFSKTQDGFLYSTNFRFRYNGFNRVIVSKHNFQDYCDFDSLTSFDGVPCIFEIRLTHDWRRALRDAISRTRIEYITRPIKEYFCLDLVGYVVVTYPEMLRKYRSRQREFLENNGLIVPFYATREVFFSDVDKIRQEHNL